MKFNVIIPVRLESSRLANKVLLDIAGKTMLEHVFERAKEANPHSIIIATDNHEIADIASNMGAEVCMTATTHQTGLERISEVIDKIGFAEDEIIVNLQGDEPLTPASVIHQVAANLANNPAAKIATLCEPFKSHVDFNKPEQVKVVMDKNGFALYFSRSPIPHAKAFASKHSFLHIGIYAFHAGFLKQYYAWERSPLEQIEQLEQLRLLWHGEKIHVDIAKEHVLPGVNTPEDLVRVREYFLENCV